MKIVHWKYPKKSSVLLQNNNFSLALHFILKIQTQITGVISYNPNLKIIILHKVCSWLKSVLKCISKKVNNPPKLKRWRSRYIKLSSTSKLINTAHNWFLLPFWAYISNYKKKLNLLRISTHFHMTLKTILISLARFRVQKFTSSFAYVLKSETFPVQDEGMNE